MKVEANTFRKHSHKTWNFERRPPPRYRSQYLRICDLYKELEFFCSRPHHCARSGFGMLRPTPRSHCRRIWLEEQFWARVLENHRAETAVEVVYPEANVFEVYNVVDKKTEPDSVLEFVVGALTKQRIVRCVTSEVHACPIRARRIRQSFWWLRRQCR